MTPENFYREVQAYLARGSTDRDRILADLKDILDLGVSPQDLGHPADYARSASGADEMEEEKAPRYSRVWDPMNPSILVPRVIGLGWDVNLGAVAVKLGWLRPDDMDEDVIEAIPDAALAVARALPIAAAIATAVASIVAATQSEGRLPSGWDAKFRPRKHASTATALLPSILISWGAAAWSSMARERHDVLSRSVFATSLSLIGTGTAIMAARATRLGDRAQPIMGVAGILVAPPLASVAAGLLPVRAGLLRTWKDAGLHG